MKTISEYAIGQLISNFFVRFLGEGRMPKSAFEINWPESKFDNYPHPEKTALINLYIFSGQQEMYSLAIARFDIPGEAGFPLNGNYIF